jgi:formylglycine-generating enzyme
MSLRRAIVFGTAGAVVFAGCGLAFPLGRYRADPVDEEAGVDGIAPRDTGPALVTCPPTEAGPRLVPTDAFCIDATEVTKGQYAEFLAAKVDVRSQREDCLWNASFVPQGGMDAGFDPELPVTWVDWCDALAFCAWAGKRLCGAIDGGTATLPSSPKGVLDQWNYACAHGEERRLYPYGDEYEAGACNEPTDGTWTFKRVATSPGCVGGYPGLFDMIGNAYEWPVRRVRLHRSPAEHGRGRALRSRARGLHGRPESAHRDDRASAWRNAPHRRNR